MKRQRDDWGRLAETFDTIRPATPYGKAARSVIDYLTGECDELPVIPLNVVDRPIYRNLPVLKALIDWDNRTVRSDLARNIITSEEEDAILVRASPMGWPNLLALNHVLLSSIKPSRKAAVVVGMRNDGIRILEWVGHYRALGFEGIFIYTNDNDDASEALLEVLANAGVITLIRNNTSGVESPQAKAFEHSLHLLPELRQYEWVFYADSDELLRLTAENNHIIQNVIARIGQLYAQKLPSAVLYNWKWFVSGNKFEQDYRPLIEVFEHSVPHHLPKSLVRLNDVVTMVPLHLPICNAECFYVDSTLAVIEESRAEDKGNTWKWKTIQYGGGQVNHYWHKSFEEYAIKKRRGDAVECAVYDYNFERFFEWNREETPENHDPCAELMLGRLYREVFGLRLIPGVMMAELAVRKAHETLLDPYGGLDGLRKLYEEFRPAR